MLRITGNVSEESRAETWQQRFIH